MVNLSVLFNPQRLVGNIFSAPGARPADALYRAVGVEFGLGDCVAQGGYVQNAAACGDDLIA